MKIAYETGLQDILKAQKAAASQVNNNELTNGTAGATTAHDQEVYDNAGEPTPIQASLLVRNAKKLGPWRIYLSGVAVHNWRQHGKTGCLDMILAKIKYEHLWRVMPAD